MKRFSEKLVRRNYAKRFLALVLAAVILLAGTAELIPVALRKQISELKTMEDSFEKQEEQVSPKENPGHRDDKEHRIKSALRQLTPVGTGVKVAFAAVALLFFLLGVCYWITVMEWMYKAAVLYGLEKRGHEVRILTLSESAHSRTEGNVIYIGSHTAGMVYPGLRVRGVCPAGIIRELVEWHPDAVHSQCEFNTFRIVATVARKCHVPLIHTYHTVYEDYTHYFSLNVRIGRSVAAWFTRHVTDRTDAVIAPTEKVRRLLTSYGTSTPVYVVPTGLELSPDTQSADAGDRRQLRRELGIPEDAKVLLYLGRLAEEKNISSLFGLLSAPGLAEAVLVLVGDGPYRQELEKQAEQSGLADRIRFAGMVPHSGVSRYYRIGDVFVNASGSETQGLTFIEAMSAGIPVVCKADPCLEGVVINGKTGYACATAEEMAGTIGKILADDALRGELTANAGALVREKYSSEAFAATMERVYRTTEIKPAYEKIAD